MSKAQQPTTYSAWNPGLVSNLPPHLRAKESLYLPSNSRIDYQQAMELHQFTGIKQERLAAFTWQRLVLHELIVRVSADILVPEGDDEEILGQRFRQIVQQIDQLYVQPQAQHLQQAFDQLQARIHNDIQVILQNDLFAGPISQQKPPHQEQHKGSWSGLKDLLSNLLISRNKTNSTMPDIVGQQFATIKTMRQQGLACTEDYQSALYKSLYVVLSAVATHRGRLPQDQDLLAKLVGNQMLNDYGSRFIGSLLDPIVKRAICEQSYQRVQNHDKPILISLKGASAAGKSTLRPLLQEDILDYGLASQNFAIISPDIWRRLFLDYKSLGEDYKYSGRLTSHEVNMVDGKLDRYIRAKAEHRQAIPNLMVDRFRFDSFNSKKIADVLHSTYVQYVDTMHMYFVITPPEATVERGWLRGLERGRYKSVEDFLGHSIEAYEGMPRLFFKWMAYQQPHYQYHFVDNNVAKGQPPRLVAWGDQQAMTIVDPLLLSNIDRYQKINIHAQNPAEVYPKTEAMSIHNNCEFLVNCINALALVEFVTAKGEQPYLQFQRQQAHVINPQLLAQLRQDTLLDSMYAYLLGTIKPTS